MNIALDSSIKAVEFNDTEVDIVEFNGVEVWTKNTPIVTTVTRQTDFVTNTHSIIPTAAELIASQVYSNINRCNVSDNGSINAYYGDNDYIEDGSNGQVMVYIPKFYYKMSPITLNGVKIMEGKWEISDVPQEGFTLHPAFYDASGNEIDYFLYGAFNGIGQNLQGVYDSAYNTTDDKLSSVAGSSYLPTTNITRATARIMANNRGQGWYSIGVKQTMAIQMLMSVEYGFNSQSSIGQGVVVANEATHTGQTVGNVTSGTQNNKTTPVNWRGIENFWGNVFDIVDGLNFNQRVPYVCDTYNFVDDTSVGYTQINFAVPSSNYIAAFGYDSNNTWLLLPADKSSSNTPSIDDYLYSMTGWRTARLGGSYIDDYYAGAFFWGCNYSSSTENATVGARIMYIPTAS